MSQILQTIESEVRSRPSAMEYEMAYQARIAIDSIRFAIKQIEQFARHSDQAREASLQLLDALDRLEAARIVTFRAASTVAAPWRRPERPLMAKTDLPGRERVEPSPKT